MRTFNNGQNNGPNNINGNTEFNQNNRTNRNEGFNPNINNGRDRRPYNNPNPRGQGPNNQQGNTRNPNNQRSDSSHGRPYGGNDRPNPNMNNRQNPNMNNRPNQNVNDRQNPNMNNRPNPNMNNRPYSNMNNRPNPNMNNRPNPNMNNRPNPNMNNRPNPNMNNGPNPNMNNRSNPNFNNNQGFNPNMNNGGFNPNNGRQGMGGVLGGIGNIGGNIANLVGNMFGSGDNIILPALALFFISQGGIGGLGKGLSEMPLIDNLKNMGGGLLDIPTQLDLSTHDIEVLLQAMQSLEPYLNDEELESYRGFSSIVSMFHKYSAIKEFDTDMARGRDEPKNKLRFNSTKEKAMHMMGTLEGFLDDEGRQNMGQIRTAITAIDAINETSDIMARKRERGENLDIKDMLGLIAPFLGANMPDAAQIDNMIKMVQIMSTLDDDDDYEPQSSGSSFYDFDDDDDEEGGFFEIILGDYDDDDDY